MNTLEWHKPYERSIQCILYSRCLAGYFASRAGFFCSRGEIAERLRNLTLGLLHVPVIRQESCIGKHLMWSAELCRLPQFDGISLRVMQTSEAPNMGIRFRVFDLNSCRS